MICIQWWMVYLEIQCWTHSIHTIGISAYVHCTYTPHCNTHCQHPCHQPYYIVQRHMAPLWWKSHCCCLSSVLFCFVLVFNFFDIANQMSDFVHSKKYLCASIHVWCCIFAVCTDLQVKWTCDFIQRRQFLGEFSSFQFLIQKMCVNECQQLSDW